MQKKLKHCDGCNRDRMIWKNHGGKRYCRQCWSAHEGTKPKKPTAGRPIPPRSPKRAKEDAQYLRARVLFLVAHSMCQAHLLGCTIYSTDVHHMWSGKDRNKYFLDENTWASLCRNCHSWIHNHPKESRELGLLK